MRHRLQRGSRPARALGFLRAPAAATLAALLLAACANVVPRLPLTLQAADGRFSVNIDTYLLQEAQSHGVALASLVHQDLTRIASLLPGPSQRVTLTTAPVAEIVASTGTQGFTDPETGDVTVRLYGSWDQEPPRIAQSLARTLAHQVALGVRVRTDRRRSPTLLEQLVTEGIGTAFDESAFPGVRDPWVGSLSAAQECRQWRHLRPVLERSGVGGDILQGGAVSEEVFGESSVPPMTGLAISYDIVAGYLSRHRDTGWAELVRTPAGTVLAGSRYRPCAGR